MSELLGFLNHSLCNVVGGSDSPVLVLSFLHTLTYMHMHTLPAVHATVLRIPEINIYNAFLTTGL